MIGEKFWVFFGQTCAVVTLIGGLFLLYDRFVPSGEAKLEVYVFPQSFTYPPEIHELVSSLGRSALRATFEDIIPNLETADRYSLVDDFTEKVISIWPERHLDQLPSYKGYLWIIVENIGDAEAANVVLDLPIKGVSTIHDKGEVGPAQRFKQTISVGTIRGSSKKSLRVWTEFTSLDENELEKIRVTHKDGLGNVSIAFDSFGILDTLQHQFGTYIFLVAFFLCMLLYCIYEWGTETGKKLSQKDEVSPSETD